MKQDDLTVFEIREMPCGVSEFELPTIIIRNKRGYDTTVPKALLNRIIDNNENDLMKDRVALYKEALKYEQYVEFEMV